MEIDYRHLYIALFIVFPILWLVAALLYVFYRGHQYQKLLKKEQEALLQILENHDARNH